MRTFLVAAKSDVAQENGYLFKKLEAILSADSPDPVAIFEFFEEVKVIEGASPEEQEKRGLNVIKEKLSSLQFSVNDVRKMNPGIDSATTKSADSEIENNKYIVFSEQILLKKKLDFLKAAQKDLALFIGKVPDCPVIDSGKENHESDRIGNNECNRIVEEAKATRDAEKFFAETPKGMQNILQSKTINEIYDYLNRFKEMSQDEKENEKLLNALNEVELSMPFKKNIENQGFTLADYQEVLGRLVKFNAGDDTLESFILKTNEELQKAVSEAEKNKVIGGEDIKEIQEKIDKLGNSKKIFEGFDGLFLEAVGTIFQENKKKIEENIGEAEINKIKKLHENFLGKLKELAEEKFFQDNSIAIADEEKQKLENSFQAFNSDVVVSIPKEMLAELWSQEKQSEIKKQIDEAYKAVKEASLKKNIAEIKGLQEKLLKNIESLQSSTDNKRVNIIEESKKIIETISRLNSNLKKLYEYQEKFFISSQRLGELGADSRESIEENIRKAFEELEKVFEEPKNFRVADTEARRNSPIAISGSGKNKDSLAFEELFKKPKNFRVADTEARRNSSIAIRGSVENKNNLARRRKTSLHATSFLATKTPSPKDEYLKKLKKITEMKTGLLAIKEELLKLNREETIKSVESIVLNLGKQKVEMEVDRLFFEKFNSSIELSEEFFKLLFESRSGNKDFLKTKDPTLINQLKKEFRSLSEIYSEFKKNISSEDKNYLVTKILSLAKKETTNTELIESLNFFFSPEGDSFLSSQFEVQALQFKVQTLGCKFSRWCDDQLEENNFFVEGQLLSNLPGSLSDSMGLSLQHFIDKEKPKKEQSIFSYVDRAFSNIDEEYSKINFINNEQVLKYKKEFLIKFFSRHRENQTEIEIKKIAGLMLNHFCPEKSNLVKYMLNPSVPKTRIRP